MSLNHISSTSPLPGRKLAPLSFPSLVPTPISNSKTKPKTSSSSKSSKSASKSERPAPSASQKTVRIKQMPSSHRELIHVSSTDPRYLVTKKLFDDGWQHADKSAKMRALYILPQPDADRLQENSRRDPRPIRASDDAQARYLFHGTRRACSIGEKSGRLCHKSECHICSIFRGSFKITPSATPRMFGPGIYSTPISSKADNYAMNHRMSSHQHAILLCRVVCNRAQQLYQAQPTRTRPDSGYNAVRAITKDKGGSVEYPEVVVYREDAIVPVALVMYTRKGWKP